MFFPVLAGLTLSAYAGRKQGGLASDTTMGSADVGFSSAKATMPTKDVLPEVVKVVIAKNDPSREEIMRAAKVAEASGYSKLAAALRGRAEGTVEKPSAIIESPWKDTPSVAWTRFCRVVAEGNTSEKISAKGFYGLFQLSVRRLCDLNVMRDPRSRNVRLPAGQVVRVWEGTWLLPKESFLSDPKLQYKLFARSMELYRSIVAEKYKQVIGLDIEGRPATLSGLLALAHAAGSGGMHKWLVDGDIRRKFTWVTEAYLRCNGIF